MAIITQFSFYVNAHAEDLRGKFVAHEGKVSLEIVYDQGGSRFTVDMSDFTTQIAGLIERSVVDPDLRQWILPEFTTTTEDDTIAASIVMMGTLQAYFEYKMTITCGIPSVTLLGEKQDYEEILARVDKLSEYGEEPTQFRKGLVPVLEGMIRTFDDPRGKEVKGFWETICDYEGGSGVDYYSGWITAFCFWDDKGGRVPRWGDDESDQELEDESEGDDEPDQVDAKDIPGGFVTVPITINDNGVTIDGELLAGSVGIMCSSSGRLSLTHAVGDVYEDGIEVNPGMVVGLDTMQPRIGWFMYEKQDAYGPVYDEEAYMLQMLRDDPDGFLEYMENLGDSEDDTE